MREQDRRTFLKTAAAGTAFLAMRSPAQAKSPAGFHIERVVHAFEEFRYRAPYKFGGVPVDRATVLNVTVTARLEDGRPVTGFGSMPLGNIWAYPSKTMGYDTTLGAMKALAVRIAEITGACQAAGHPIELNHQLEPAYLQAAATLSAERKLAEAMPKLAVQVAASAFDAALHDAYGKARGKSAYQALSRAEVGHDLPRYLNGDFKDADLQAAILPKPRPEIPLFHSVGGADAVTPAELAKPVGDGLPETLADWIKFNGLIRIKIKLQGENLDWDIDRTIAIDRVARETRPDTDWKYCCDFNERCPNAEYLLEFLRKVKEKSPRGFENILYLEQPTARNLAANPENRMHEAAKLRPVVIDESLTDLESLLLARELGYTGVCLKACKGQSHAVLMALAAQKYGMFLCVQDLTCPGASLIHSAGIAAHVPGMAGIEANSRQYMPAANAPWAEKFPGIFKITDGKIHTAELGGPGLGIAEWV